MKSVYNFVITPKGSRYNNTKKIGDKELILNTEIYNHQYVNREATVISTPIVGEDLGIKPGDTVITHFNVFRRWHDIKGIERNSRSYFDEKTYLITKDQIFLYKRNKSWLCPKGYCFIQPIRDTDKFSVEIEKPFMGVVKYSDGTVNTGDIVGYRPKTECEFIVDDVRLYRILSNLITIKYGHQKNEEAYNPSWTQSG
tara:strand:+ start:547 stop:1140 length:594 start_codon:yes stop_codon:yes gene_type:complete